MIDDMAKPKEIEEKPRRRIQSIDFAIRILRVLEQTNGAMPLKNIAAECAMSPSKTYVYLASLVHSDLVTQDATTGHYKLGQFATELGLAALRQIDVIKLSNEPLEALRDKTRCAAVLSIWSNSGPTIVLRFDGDYQGSFGIRLGHVLSLNNSATGYVFMAYMPRSVVDPVLKSRATAQSGEKALFAGLDRRKVDTTLEEIRRLGYSRVSHEGHSGFAAISTPVFDHGGQIAAVVTLLGAKPLLNDETLDAFTEHAQSAAALISSRLGYSLPKA